MSTQAPSRRRAVRLNTDPRTAARAAHLRYVNDDEPGIHRVRAGKGFGYVGPDGARIHDKATLERIKALVIPPAWTDVWICADEDGHIQVTGRDDRGRKQYRYHPRWQEVRGETKFNRMMLFGQALPRIRERVEQDLSRRGLPREKVLAAVVRLLGSTFIRVGNMEYARDNDSFGLTTLHDEHVEVDGAKIHFEFRGKSGKDHVVEMKDRRLAQIVKRCQDVPGQDLFQYTDDQGGAHRVTSADVNAYLQEISGESFTAKDFRTWGGTILALQALAGLEPFATETACKQNLVAMYKAVSAQLGNTVAVCRKYYVYPLIAELYRSGALADTLESSAANGHDVENLQQWERVLIDILSRQNGSKSAQS